MKGLTDSLQKQQGDIDALKDMLRARIDEADLSWDFDTQEINVCDLQTYDDSYSGVILREPLVTSALSAVGTGFFSYFSKRSGVAAAVGAISGLLTYGITSYYSDPVISRELYYRVSKVAQELVDEGSDDPRPSYDVSRALVDGIVYECTPFVRVTRASGKQSDHFSLGLMDPDREVLLKLDIFRNVSWFVSKPVDQLINSAMVKEVLTRRTLPEKSSSRVRRILATHDRICGATELLLSTGRSDFRDSSLMCELVVNRSTCLNERGSSERSYSDIARATLTLIFLMPQLRELLLLVASKRVLFWIGRQLQRPFLGY